MKKSVELSIMAGVLVVSLSIAYYLVIALPQKETARKEQQKQEQARNVLDAFAQSYSGFSVQRNETSIDSVVPIIDTSTDENGKETGEKNYFTYLAGAVNSKQTNASRKSNAEQALLSYNSFNQKLMDDFWKSIDKLDSSTSRLVEAANKINNEEYRSTAIEVTKYARQIQQNYESLRLKYVERFEVQIEFLEKLVENDGNLPSLGITFLKSSGGKVTKISEDVKSLNEEISKISQKMNDTYLSLKGRAGLKDYPNSNN
jgi:type II secretory pathway pseudopilin PulG